MRVHERIIFSILLCVMTGLCGESQVNPFVKLVNPVKESNTITASRQFLVGSTCVSCNLLINSIPVKVYSSGGFAAEVNITTPDTTFTLVSTNSQGSISKSVRYIYSLPVTPKPVDSLAIESIETFPAGNLVLSPGDKIEFRVKALPGSQVTTFNGARLYEIPVAFTRGMPGIYQGEYVVKPGDNFTTFKIPVTLINTEGRQVVKETTNSFSILSPLSSTIARTTGRLAYLKYGLGEDRLGGAKIGYLDSLVRLLITGKVGSDYKVQLAKNKIAYIPEALVTLMPKGSFEPAALTGSWRVFGDSTFDYVSIGLSDRLPYQAAQQLHPSKITVDIFGAVSNTNWVTQLRSAKEIEDVQWEQVADDIFRVTIFLKHRQHWGHSIYYNANNLMIRVRRPPVNPGLRNLVIAVDAGHGGSNTGAGGPTGISEKDLTLQVALKLEQALLREGVKVIMTRSVEKLVDNNDRILFYRDSLPQLLVSIHMNSAADPIRAGGTSTLYRYVGFRPLSTFINNRMLELGLREYGNIGSFNFMLNSPTEYPNALVETLFISNPAEEALILDEKFQQQVAEKIVSGIKDFLSYASSDSK